VAYPPAVPLGVNRVQLHSGLSGGVKAFLGVCLIGAMVIGVPILGLITGAFASLAVPGAGWIVGSVVGVLCAVPLIWRLLWLFRTAAWLEHTTLVVRGPFTRRRCDLAMATRFEFDKAPEYTSTTMPGGGVMVSTTGYVPRLIAYDAATGRRVRLKLADPATKQWLTPPKLHALANAILARRGQVPDGSPAWQIATALRAMAADPAGPLR
jgi:hypothetical protein